MTRVAVLGAGAFGTALALTLARAQNQVVLWARNRAQAQSMQETRLTGPRLPGFELPDNIVATGDISEAAAAKIVLIAVPMQGLDGLLSASASHLRGKSLVACNKGVDLSTGLGPTGVIESHFPDTPAAVLTGPSFAVDIAADLPTALTLACTDDAAGAALQAALSTPTLRVYRTSDTTGAELGGALKNVIALAAGLSIGAGLGESARAATITRGFAEITRFAVRRGARAETLNGLSGMGDLILTCTSEQSRNYAAGLRLARGQPLDAGHTIEGVATARAVARNMPETPDDLPLVHMVADVLDGVLSLDRAVEALLKRPLKQE